MHKARREYKIHTSKDSSCKDLEKPPEGAEPISQKDMSNKMRKHSGLLRGIGLDHRSGSPIWRAVRERAQISQHAEIHGLLLVGGNYTQPLDKSFG